MKTIIKVENVSKRYRLGQVGTGTISHDLNAFIAKVRGKENPNLKIEANNKLISSSGFHQALNDVSFDVKEGEVLGLIGKNGAGKSTILKILSRVTTPTSGQIKVKGRIASLLEVGTGFHAELSGRENIFLNGAILGMSKFEIKKKFDEIVEFSGVEKYIDTPVKRYSSGMYVRLAFAVAAHLEPEILVVDEVLAVGDVEFQNKCLGKMGEVSKQGRTILFVSHNMQALIQLCSKGIVLQNGEKIFDGTIQEAVKKYLEKNISVKEAAIDYTNFTERKGNLKIKIQRIELFNISTISNKYVIGDDLKLKLFLESKETTKSFNIAFHFYRYDESIFANVENIDSNYILEPFIGEKCFEIDFKSLNFYPDTYKVGISIGSGDWSEYYDQIIPLFEFVIVDGSKIVKRKLSPNGGFIFLSPTWKSL